MPRIRFNDKDLVFVWDLAGGFSPEETFMVGQTRSTMRLRCSYDKRHEIIEALTGYSYLEKVGSKTVLKRKIPLEYPYHRGIWCVGSPRNEGLTPYGKVSDAERVRTLPKPIFVPVAGLPLPVPLMLESLPNYAQPNFLDSRVTLQFSSLPYVPMDDSFVTFGSNTDLTWAGIPDDGEAVRRGIKRYIHRTATPAGKFITIPGNFLYFKEVGFPIPQSSAVIFQPAMDIKYDWYNVPEKALPQFAWNSIPGSVNNEAFDGFPAGTLLCLQPSFRQETNPFGQPECIVTYSMRFLPNFDPPPPDGRGGTLPGDTITVPPTGTARGHNWVYNIITGELVAKFGYLAPYKGKILLMEVSSRGSTGTVADPTPRPVAPLLDTSPPHRLADFRDLFRPAQIL